MPGLAPGVGWALTLAFCLLSSVLFRAGSIQAARNVFASLATFPTPGLLRESFLATVIAVLAIAWPAGRTLYPRLVSPLLVSPRRVGSDRPRVDNSDGQRRYV